MKLKAFFIIIYGLPFGGKKIKIVDTCFKQRKLQQFLQTSKSMLILKFNFNLILCRTLQAEIEIYCWRFHRLEVIFGLWALLKPLLKGPTLVKFTDRKSLATVSA